MTIIDDVRLNVMARLVEIAELNGSAREASREALVLLQQQQDIVPILIELIRGDDLGYFHRAIAIALLADWQERRLLPVLQELIDTGNYELQEAALLALSSFN